MPRSLAPSSLARSPPRVFIHPSSVSSLSPQSFCIREQRRRLVPPPPRAFLSLPESVLEHSHEIILLIESAAYTAEDSEKNCSMSLLLSYLPHSLKLFY